MMCLNPKFDLDHNLAFFALGPWAIIHGVAQIGKFCYLSNMIPFERSLSKLSENQKIVEIGSTELKLWLLKEFLSH